MRRRPWPLSLRPSRPPTIVCASTGPACERSLTGAAATPTMLVLRSQIRPAALGPRSTPILAGFAELLAERAGVSAPPWIRSVPAPPEPWAPPGTPAMRARAEATNADAFGRRNIILPVGALFRDAADPSLADPT